MLEGSLSNCSVRSFGSMLAEIGVDGFPSVENFSYLLETVSVL